MINIRDLRIDPASLGTKKWLVDIMPAYEYKDGKRTDTVTGYRYIVALPAHGLEKLGIKIDGKQLVEKPEGFIEVEFAGLELRVMSRSLQRPPVFPPSGKISSRSWAVKVWQPGKRYFSMKKNTPRRQRRRHPARHKG